MPESSELEHNNPLLPKFVPNVPPVSDLLFHTRKQRVNVLVAYALSVVFAGLAAPATYLGLKVNLGFGVVTAVGCASGAFCGLVLIVTSMLQYAEQVRTSTGLRLGLNQPEKLFALACEGENLETARVLRATGEISNQMLCDEALRLWTEKKAIEAVSSPWAPKACAVLAWLLDEIAAAAPAQLWVSTNSDWTELVMAWAAGSLALGPRWPGTAVAIFGSADRHSGNV
jgi:hypothetical protein